MAKLITWSTHLAEIVRREPTHMRFYNASIPRAAGMWLNPSSSSYSLVCRHPCLPDIIYDLFLVTNPVVNLTNSNLELATLVLHEATLFAEVPAACMAAPRSGSDNTPTVSWSMREASTITLVIAGLLRICVLHSRQFFLNPSIFYHPGQENFMSDDASCHFDLPDTSFLAHMSVAYPHPLSLCQIPPPPPPPPPELLSCVISMLHRKSCEQVLLMM